MDFKLKSFSKLILLLFPLFLCVVSIIILTVINYRNNVLGYLEKYSTCKIEFDNGTKIELKPIYEVFNLYHYNQIGTQAIKQTENVKTDITGLIKEKLNSDSFECHQISKTNATFSENTNYLSKPLFENIVFTFDQGETFYGRSDIDSLFKKYEQIGSLYSLLDTYISDEGRTRFVYGLSRDGAPKSKEDATNVIELEYFEGELIPSANFENIDSSTISTCYIGKDFRNYEPSFIRFSNSGNQTSVELINKDEKISVISNVDNGGISQLCPGKFSMEDYKDYLSVNINQKEFAVFFSFENETRNIKSIVNLSEFRVQFDDRITYDLSVKEITPVNAYVSSSKYMKGVQILTSNNVYMYFFLNDDGNLECSDAKYKEYYTYSPLYNCSDLKIEGAVFEIKL